VFPGEHWEYKHPGELGCSEEKMAAIADWFKANAGDKKYRAVVVRGGYLIADGVTGEQKFDMASIAMSLYSSMLGIAIAEGKIGSADDKVVDYYPEMMDVAEDEGPKKEATNARTDTGRTRSHRVKGYRNSNSQL
jgi:CubicO group peptidase (beta-lactamase class C family)